MSERVEKGQRWIRKRDMATVRVMGVVEGYVVVRIPSCVPFLVGVKDFLGEYDKAVPYGQRQEDG